MLKKAALAVGAVFLLIGILGFIPLFAPLDPVENARLLLGIFEVDTLHNLIHILSGIAFLAAAGKERTARLAFQVFGVVYALVTLIGFLTPDGANILGLFHANLADDFLHLLLTAAFLYLGFGVPAERRATV
ncbi:MAG TPA: DUF4383 domain-containing protein [Candidatus Saccharimonadales bacterium]|nr:DUF4383 domain-containing protein [Candidatus Saccharimonadales bacterium]